PALGLAEGGEDARVGTAPGRRVGVEAEDGHLREPLGEQRLHLLGAETGAREGRRVALAAGPGKRLRVGAVVADESAGLAVDDQRDIAVRAAPVTAARAAGEPG